IEAAWRQRGDFLCQLKGQGVRELEGWRIVEGAELARHGLLDLLASVPGAAAPQARKGVEDLAALVVIQPVALRAYDDARVFLQGAVGRARHPVGLEVERLHQTHVLKCRELHIRLRQGKEDGISVKTGR